jgi:hypothetical protein
MAIVVVIVGTPPAGALAHPWGQERQLNVLSISEGLVRAIAENEGGVRQGGVLEARVFVVESDVDGAFTVRVAVSGLHMCSCVASEVGVDVGSEDVVGC